MKVELTWIEQRKCSKEVDLPFDEDYLESGDVFNEDDILTLINDYYNYTPIGEKLVLVCLTESEKDCCEDLYATVINTDELIEKYKYLIKQPSCCDSQTGNYCSVCGKKLK